MPTRKWLGLQRLMIADLAPAATAAHQPRPPVDEGMTLLCELNCWHGGCEWSTPEPKSCIPWRQTYFWQFV